MCALAGYRYRGWLFYFLDRLTDGLTIVYFILIVLIYFKVIANNDVRGRHGGAVYLVDVAVVFHRRQPFGRNPNRERLHFRSPKRFDAR